jgi:hypothetical protein
MDEMSSVGWCCIDNCWGAWDRKDDDWLSCVPVVEAVETEAELGWWRLEFMVCLWC